MYFDFGWVISDQLNSLINPRFQRQSIEEIQDYLAELEVR